MENATNRIHCKIRAQEQPELGFLLPDDSFMNDSFLGGNFLGRKLIEYGQLPIYIGFEIKGMFALRRIFQFNRSKTADDRLPGMVV